MTRENVLAFEIDREVDLVVLRQRSRRVAEVFGFDNQDQTRIATAVSEIARHAAARGTATVAFAMDERRAGVLLISLESRAAHDADARDPVTPNDEGFIGARRLMEAFAFEQVGAVQRITLEKRLPRHRAAPAAVDIRAGIDSLATIAPDPVAEMRAQNRELLLGLSEVKDKQDELERLNQELENTNRGVVALYAELDQKSSALLELNRTLEERVEVAVRERQQVQEALRQSQKMEAVGQLTGGIAHDFNNLLQAIVGNLELMGRNLPADQPRIERSLGNAMRAAKSASNLTQRLLAFSRRQALVPRKVDAGQLVVGMTELLRRTLGETIEVRTVLWHEPCVIEIDPHELENAILNLAVNARDAMPDGGSLVIETRAFDGSIPFEPATDCAPTRACVEIAVRDTGSGIPEHVRSRVFEPFFTTKEVGKGTGLGLSMVYGFAKQSGGDIAIDSVVGRGTAVRLFFCRTTGDAEAATDASDVPIAVRGDETILVVEDSPDVLAYSSGALEELGYRVLVATDGPSAMKVIRSVDDIDLLFSDVVLAGGMTGRQLAEQAIARRPGLRVLFTSGYARDALETSGRIEPGMELIGKPFTYIDLAQRVNVVLRNPRGWLRDATVDAS